MLAMNAGDQKKTLQWLAVTGLFGAAFVGVELYEFNHLIHEGAGPQRSGFLSAFFALVGTHGLHVTFGIVWLIVLMVQVDQARPDRRQPAADHLPVALLALPRPRLDRGLHLRLPAGGPAMSAEHRRHDAHGDAHDESGAPHGTYRDYMTGFVLAVVLTVIPFFLVMARPIESPGYTAAIVLVCAFAQILVHMVFFLHMTPKAEDGWLLLSTIFAIVFLVITLAGSIWIIFHLNRNMMPMPDGELMQEMQQEAPAPE